MRKSRPVVRRLVVCFLLALGLLLGRPAVAQRAMPDAAPLNNFNPLCDSSLVHCLEIEHFAGHVYGHLQVLPQSERRDTAAVFPFGGTLGLFGRFAGGISSSYAFCREGHATLQQLGPLRLNLTARLLPLFPLSSLGSQAEGKSSDDAPRRFRLGLAYEHEVRVGPFSGANALGLLTNLASLHLVFSKWLGPFQVSTSLGVLFDWQGAFAAGTVAGQLGWLIPGFHQLKVFIQAMGRGLPSYVKTEALPLLPDGPDPIRPQGLVGGGLAFRAQKRVDLGVEVQRGLGSGIAPWVVSINFLVISGGKEHEGRAVTPLAGLAVDVMREFGTWAAEKLQAIDPYLKKDCILYDENHRPTVKLGELGPDGKACIYQGLAVPIGPRFWHNEADTRLCYDEARTKCFLSRLSSDDPWAPIHPMLVSTDCMAYLEGQPWMRIGKPNANKDACEWDGHQIPVGQTLQPDHGHPGYYCYDEPDKAKGQTKKLWCYERPDRPQLDGAQRFSAGVSKEVSDLKHQAALAQQFGTEVAAGVPLHATTPMLEAEQAARNAMDRVKNLTLDDAKRVYYGVVAAAKKWHEKPTYEKTGDVLEHLGGAAASPTTYLPVAGTALQEAAAVVKGAEDLAEIAKAGQKAAQGLKAAEHAEHAATDILKAKRQVVKALPPKSEPRALLSGRPEPKKPPQAGRFIVDEKGNVLIEPKFGSTVGNSQGTFVETRYPNGSPAYQLHEAHPKTRAKEPHGHHMEQGSGPGRGNEGPSLDRWGNRVRDDSPVAHWPVKR